jgi:hypothetical protein
MTQPECSVILYTSFSVGECEQSVAWGGAILLVSESGTTGDPELTEDMRRVLIALCAEPGSHEPGAMIALRRMARATLSGDTDRAVRTLADLDARGYIRTNVMGWHIGWVTPQGRDAALRCRASR